MQSEVQRLFWIKADAAAEVRRCRRYLCADTCSTEDLVARQTAIEAQTTSLQQISASAQQHTLVVYVVEANGSSHRVEVPTTFANGVRHGTCTLRPTQITHLKAKLEECTGIAAAAQMLLPNIRDDSSGGCGTSTNNGTETNVSTDTGTGISGDSSVSACDVSKGLAELADELTILEAGLAEGDALSLLVDTERQCRRKHAELVRTYGRDLARGVRTALRTVRCIRRVRREAAAARARRGGAAAAADAPHPNLHMDMDMDTELMPDADPARRAALMRFLRSSRALLVLLMGDEKATARLLKQHKVRCSGVRWTMDRLASTEAALKVRVPTLRRLEAEIRAKAAGLLTEGHY